MIVAENLQKFSRKSYRISSILIVTIHCTENFGTLNRIVKQYGKYARVWIGPELNILLTDPKDVEVINAT